jgi:hypothetical protein
VTSAFVLFALFLVVSCYVLTCVVCSNKLRFYATVLTMSESDKPVKPAYKKPAVPKASTKTGSARTSVTSVKATTVSSTKPAGTKGVVATPINVSSNSQIISLDNGITPFESLCGPGVVDTMSAVAEGSANTGTTAARGQIQGFSQPRAPSANVTGGQQSQFHSHARAAEGFMQPRPFSGNSHARHV